MILIINEELYIKLIQYYNINLILKKLKKEIILIIKQFKIINHSLFERIPQIISILVQ